MFVTYFPTELTGHDVETLRLDHDCLHKLVYRTPFNAPNRDHKKDSLISPGEFSAPFIRFGNIGIPLETGILCLDYGPDQGQKTMYFGYDKKDNSYQSIPTQVINEKFENCQKWNPILSFGELLFNVFARATNLKSDAKITTPTALRFNFPGPDGEIDLDTNAERFRFAHGNDDSNTKYIALVDNVWVMAQGKTMTSLDNGAVVPGEFDRSKAQAYSIEDPSFNNRDRFTFHSPSPFESHYHYRQLNINVPCSPLDPDIGRKLFESLGIKFDVVDNVKFKNGEVDPAIFIEGTEEFAIVKSKVRVFNMDKVHALKAKYFEEEQPKSKKKSRFQPFHMEDRVLELENIYLTCNFDGELTDKVLNHIPRFDYRVNFFINKVLDGEGEERSKGSEPTETTDIFGEPSRHSREERFKRTAEILRDITEEREIYLPAFTPRLESETNAIINSVIKRKNLISGLGYDIVFRPNHIHDLSGYFYEDFS